MDLSPTQLRAVVTLADHGTFTAAAAALGVSQPSLSRAVAECERRLRTRLFERTTRRVRVTPEGREVLELARRLVRDYDDGLRHLAGYLAGTHGSLRIAALPSLAATLLPPFVLTMRTRYPGVHVAIDDALGGSVQERLARGDADVAVTARSQQPRAEQLEIPLARDEFFAAVPADDPWSGADHLPWTALAERPLVVFTGASTIRGLVDSALARHRVEVGEVVEASNVGTVGGLVAAGLGTAVVPGFVLPLLAFADLHYIPLRPRVTRHIVVAHRSERPLGPPARAWLDLLLDPGTERPGLPGVTWAVHARNHA
ncbi:LysR family transcriptional regulator [Ornithinimicrobium humiphilum]|nr:LysR family transcriptional regulator [Ornithinimicrobium humiphilum]